MAEMKSTKDKLVSFRSLLNVQAAEIAKAVPKGVDPQRFARAALTLFVKNQALLDCSPQSVMGALMQAAQYGLELDPNMGQAYLVPYKTQCQLIVGYQGLIALAMRTPDVKSVVGRAVFERDHFSHEYGLEEKLVHRPFLGADRGALVAVYAVAKLVDKDGVISVFDVMSRSEVDLIRSRSRAKDSGPWITDYDAMARKTVVRRLSKWLPKATEFAAAVAEEERWERGESSGVDKTVQAMLDDANTIDAETVAPTEPSAIDKLAQDLPDASKKPVEARKAPAAVQDDRQATRPAEAAADVPAPVRRPRRQTSEPGDPRPSPPVPETAQERSLKEQQERHEVPRAHQAQAHQAPAAAEPADDDMSADEISWGSSE